MVKYAQIESNENRIPTQASLHNKQYTLVVTVFRMSVLHEIGLIPDMTWSEPRSRTITGSGIQWHTDETSIQTWRNDISSLAAKNEYVMIMKILACFSWQFSFVMSDDTQCCQINVLDVLYFWCRVPLHVIVLCISALILSGAFRKCRETDGKILQR